MSGDVQPRRRKDKKRKRDEDESSHGVHITKMAGDDVHLHVHEDHGTGGHWCAKLFFFCLLTILLGLIGLILLENRGLADLDTPLSESRFSNYFNGWVDELREGEHEQEHAPASIEHDEHEHDEPYEETEDDAEDDEEDDEDVTQEQNGDDDAVQANDNDNDEDEDEDDDDNTMENNAEEDDEDEGDDDDNDNENDADNEATQEDNDEDDDDNISKAPTKDNDDVEDDDDGQTVENNAEDEDDDNDEDDDGGQTVENNAVDNDEDDNDKDEYDNDDVDDDDENEADKEATQEDNANNDEDDEEIEPIYVRSTQPSNAKVHSTNNDDNDDDDDEEDPFDEEEDNDFDSLENVVDNDAEELLLLQEKARQQAEEAAKNEPPINENDNDDDDTAQSWLASLAVKLGVGVALALVARLVLIRENPKSMEEPNPAILMKRRLTIANAEDSYPEETDEIVPPLPEDEDYSEEEVEIIEEIEYVEDDDDDDGDDEVNKIHDIDIETVAAHGKYIPETFEQLNAMYKAKDDMPTFVGKQIEQIPVTNIKTQPKFTTNATTISSQAQKNTSAVLNASQPPTTRPAPSMPSPLTESNVRKQDIRDAASKLESTALFVGVAGATSKLATKEPPAVEESPPQTRIREVTHDIDYDYNEEDDDEYLDEEEEDEFDDDLLNNDLSDDNDEDEDEEVSDVDDSELMNRLEAKYGRLPAKEYESDEDPDDPTWTQIKPKVTKDTPPSGGPQAADDLDAFEEELRSANEEMMREFNYH